MDLISMALASTLACQAPDNQQIVGLWESTAISRGGIGHNFEFRNDGSYTTAAVVLVDLSYDIKDGKFYVSKNMGEPVNYEQGVKIEISEKAVILSGEDGKKEIKNRTTVSSAKSIVGKYKYRHYTGAIAYEQYTDDGLMKLRLPMKSVAGCYSLKEKTITATQPGKDPKEMKYKLDNGVLHLEDSRNTYSYNLVKEGAWYKSDEIDYQKPAE